MIWAFAFNILVNSLLSFLTAGLIVTFFLFLFRVKDYRLRSLLLCLPVLKLLVDPFLYDFQHWALTQHINPIYAEAGSRVISAMIYYPSTLTKYIPIGAGIQLTINNTQTFSIADLLFLSIDTHLMKGIITLVVAVSFTGLTVWLYRMAQSLHYIYLVKTTAHPCLRGVYNPILLRRLLRSHAEVKLSSIVDVPCAIGIFKKRIYFPTQLIDQLTQNEFEAIIAHEMSHLRWYDGVTQSVCHFASTLFWWIPTQKLLNSIEYNHECASDDYVTKYKISRLDLASAIVKAAKGNGAPQPVTCFVKSNNKHRLYLLLQPMKRSHYFIQWIQGSIECIVIVAVLFGKLWIF